jgi:hypothetical protein
VLLAFYDYPAEHWIHLRTTNPIESTFATVRHRTRVTKDPGSRPRDGVQTQTMYRTPVCPIGHVVAGRGRGRLIEAFAPDPGDALDTDRRGGHVNRAASVMPSHAAGAPAMRVASGPGRHER